MNNIKTKFSLFPIFICLFITVTGIAVFILSYTSPVADLYLPIFGILFVCFFWLTEFRTKAHNVHLKSATIVVRQYFGLGKRKGYLLSDIKGFITTKQTGGAGKYEYIFIVDDNRRLISVSSFYHRNYELIKQELKNNVLFLGEKKFSFIEEYAEMLK